MTTPRPTNGNTRLYIWIMGALFSIISIISGAAYARINSAVEENTKLTTKHESELPYIKETNARIEHKVDDLNDKIDEFLLKRFGYIPAES